MGYERQKTWQAVDSLISDRPIRDRLRAASVHLKYCKVYFRGEKANELSEELDSILLRLSYDRETIDKLTDREANKISEEILSLMMTAFGGL